MVHRPTAPWFNNNIRQSKQYRRKFERTWRRTGSEYFRAAYKEQCRVTNALVHQTKYEYYSSKIEEHGCDAKALFNITKALLGQDT